MEFEYIENDESTWRFYPPPPFPKEAQKELIRIAGLNRLGQPNLKIVWGGTEKTDRHRDHTLLKYHCGYSPIKTKGFHYIVDGETKFTADIDTLDPSIMVIPAIETEELGLCRWVIEKWVSPEELKEQHRFETRAESGDLIDTLRHLPREGVYDPFFIVQTLDEKYRPIDKLVLEVIELKWHQSFKSFEEQEFERELYMDRQKKSRQSFKEDIVRAAGDFDLRLDPEERERREHYWAHEHDYTNKEMN